MIGLPVQGQSRCQATNRLPCMADIRTLAGLEPACEVCAPHMHDIRKYGWKPVTGTAFFMCDKLTVEQSDRLLDEMNARKATPENPVKLEFSRGKN